MADIQNFGPTKAQEAFDGADLEARTELGKEFIRQLRKAMWNKANTKVGEYSLNNLLKMCKNAREDAPSSAEREMREKYPGWAYMPVSIMSFKVGILVALMRETLVDVAGTPFIIEPTPDPEIPEEKRNEILDRLSAEIKEMSMQVAEMQENSISTLQQMGASLDEIPQDSLPHIDPAQLAEHIKNVKIQAMREVREHAKEQALVMQRKIYDKAVEGDYRKAVMEFIDDFVLYPFGCIHGPYPTVQSVTKWKKNKYVEVDEVVWSFERVSPFDLFWLEDCTNTQDGTAIFVRKRVPYSFLFDAKRMAKQDKESGYFLSAIQDLIDLTKEEVLPKNWTDFHSNNPEVKLKPLVWSSGDTIEIVIRYGRFRGHELAEMGFENLESERSYETKVVLCGGEIIQAQLNNNPGKYKRPVFTASFEKRNNSIAGVGLGQKLLGVHNAYRACIMLALYNLGLSSEPITEIEIERVMNYLPTDWDKNPSITPGQVIISDGDRMGNGSRAVKFTQIPNITSQALSMAQHIFELSHTVSNIPAALHGQPVGSGANRTVRGLLTLQGNTLKPIHSSLMNFDMEVIEPMVSLMYMLMVMYDNDFDFSGDCKVVAKGSASMVQREMDKQAAMENLQIVGQVAQHINPDIINRTVENLLILNGILEPGERVTQSANSMLQGSPQQGIPGTEPLPQEQANLQS